MNSDKEERFMNNKIIETTNDELEIGRWGEAWQRFMRENYPTESAELINTERWDELALEVEREALDMWELLRRQYAKANPRPTDFMETVKWEKTRGFYIDHEIMEQIVLQFRA